MLADLTGYKRSTGGRWSGVWGQGLADDSKNIINRFHHAMKQISDVFVSKSCHHNVVG